MRLAILAFLLASTCRAFPQTPEKEPIAILELGTEGERTLDGSGSLGPNLAVEVTPIEHWLELELGVSPLFSHGQREWDTDLLFKKPYTLSRTAEFMFGIGPEWAHTTAAGKSSNSIAGEAALDFMFWPSRRRKFGWYLEPTYSYDFGPGHEQSLSLSGGLLIAIP